MRIIYVENVRIPSERAHAYQIVQTCAWLARFGATLELVNPDRTGGADLFEYFKIESRLFKHTCLPVIDALSWKWLPWKSAAYAMQRWSFVRALRNWSLKQEADIWFTRDPAMVDALKGRGRRIILELHDRPDRQTDRWKRILPSIAGFVVITHGLRDVLVGLGVPSEKIIVAPDGYDPTDFVSEGDPAAARRELGLPANGPVVYYAGGFYPWKGVDTVVSAWSQIYQDIHLVLIGGPDPDRKRIESLVPKGREHLVHIFPYKPHAEVVRLMAAGDIGLLSTSEKEEIGRSFTSPLKQFEYLAAGLPILASDVPSSREILTDQVARFYVADGSDLAVTIETVLSDRAWLVAARVAAKSLVRAYTWEARSKAVSDFLKKIV